MCRVDRNRSGSITAEELQAALSNGNSTQFNIHTVNMMIGQLSIHPFYNLFFMMNCLYLLNINWITQVQQNIFRNPGFYKICGRKVIVPCCYSYVQCTLYRIDCYEGMFDGKKTGEINLTDFGSLWRYIVDWQNCFKNFDRWTNILSVNSDRDE